MIRTRQKLTPTVEVDEQGDAGTMIRTRQKLTPTVEVDEQGDAFMHLLVDLP
jgi:hypothetical protein